MSKTKRALPFIRSNLKTRAGPSGIHLFNRKTGLNVLLDEVRVPPALWAGAPRQVSIALTNKCDLACPYCFAPKNPIELEFDRVTTWLDELDANGCLGIGFGGGEPTLYQRLAELCHYATQSTSLAVTLTTHAHHLDNDLVAALSGSVHFMRVSMDGVETTYEELRGHSFAAFQRSLEKVRSIAPFGINYVVNARTLPDLDAAAKLAADAGATEFLLLPEQSVQGAGGIDDQTAQALKHWIIGYGGDVPITVSEAGADGLPICNPIGDERDLGEYAHIDASGILKRTSFDNHGVAIDAIGIMRALEILRQKEIKP
jgi:sulfatase maturation enzyme AslB (radical SAM superfamily)